MVIGITGTDGAGKGSVVASLVKRHGFTHYSARDFILAEIHARGLTADRAQMRMVANDLRRQYGDDVTVARALARAREAGVRDAVIESIRTLGEVATLRAAGGILLAVDANPKIRYTRIVKRGSDSDHVTFEEFVAHEAVEMRDPDPHGMQKADVIAAADYTITNNEGYDELNAAVDTFLATFHYER